MAGQESGTIPQDVLDGIRHRNDEIATINIRMLSLYPSPLAVQELLDLVENGGRSAQLNEAARLTILKILGKMDAVDFARAVKGMCESGMKSANEIMALVGADRELAARIREADPALFVAVSLGAIEASERMRDRDLPIEERISAANLAESESALEFVEELRISGDPSAFEILMALASGRALNAELRAKAIEELATWGKEEAIPVFEKALRDENPRIRHQAIFSLPLLWTDAAENRVETILGNHLGEESDRFLKLEIIEWLGKNAHHTAAKRALVKTITNEEDRGVADAAERAAEELGGRLDARPSIFQSGVCFDAATIPPQECGGSGKYEDENLENTAEPEDETLAPDVLRLGEELREAKEPQERARVARALAMIAKMTMNRAEAESIERILRNEGEEEFSRQIAEVGKKIDALLAVEKASFRVPRPSHRPTPPINIEEKLLESIRPK
ncbi:MAG: HEAT repeat domain-containing protein [Candidatus Bilamarchaeaceae archaeon]